MVNLALAPPIRRWIDRINCPPHQSSSSLVIIDSCDVASAKNLQDTRIRVSDTPLAHFNAKCKRWGVTTTLLVIQTISVKVASAYVSCSSISMLLYLLTGYLQSWLVCLWTDPLMRCYDGTFLGIRCLMYELLCKCRWRFSIFNVANSNDTLSTFGTCNDVHNFGLPEHDNNMALL